MILAAVLLCAAVAPAARGQDSELVRRLDRQLRQLDATYRLAVPQDQPIAERLVFDYGASVRFGFLSIDNERGESRFLRQTDGTLSVRADLDGAHRFFGRMRFLYNDYNTGDSFDGRGDELDEPIGDRYWYQFDLRGAVLADRGERIDHNLTLKAGRQYVHWNTGLVLSNVLYAGLIDLEAGPFGLVGLGGFTTPSSTVDMDGSRPGFDSDTRRAVYGARFEYRGLATHRPFVSALIQRDENTRDFAAFRTPILTYPTRFHYDSEYYSVGSSGSIGPAFTYSVEVVHERGEGMSNSFDRDTGFPIAQTREDISAWAGIARLTYLVRDAADTRVDLEFMAGTGDDDRIDSSDTFGGNERGTTDDGFNSLGYINTGLALAPDISNLLSLRAGFSTSPNRGGERVEWLRFGMNAFLFAKADQSAPINVRTNAATFVGGELDFFIDWRVASDVEISLRYGLFLPGDAMPAGEDDPRHFLYAGVTYAF